MTNETDKNPRPNPASPGIQPPDENRGQGGGQPKPGQGQEPAKQNPDIPKEIPKREIDRKPSDPQSEPEQGPRQDKPEKGRENPTPDIPESEENNDVQEQSPDIVGEREIENDSIIDKRDRFPFPNK
ncbi:hypothetical protein [Chitinophaga caseinilytica]|uniref:hypothetical protein n=1 Tax=Chitinophaga caseinilytica TaxID=2267521 RepID=UPI003C2DBC7A